MYPFALPEVTESTFLLPDMSGTFSMRLFIDIFLAGPRSGSQSEDTFTL